MTQTSFSSIRSNSTNSSRTVWLSKLACRRDEQSNVDDIEKCMLSSNDSIEMALPILVHDKFSNRRIYNNIPSFPMCLVGCSKNDDETSGSETLADFDNLQTNHENDTTRDDNTQEKTINREVLSPTIQLLHEVYLKKWPSSTGLYFLPRRSKILSQKELHFDPETIQARADLRSNYVDEERNDADTILQKRRMMFRQQLRYDAIRKELFDDVSNSTFEKNSVIGVADPDFRTHEQSETDSVLDAAVTGCQGTSFWNYIPNMSNLLLNVIPENEVIDDDSDDYEESDENSYSVGTNDGQSFFSYGTEGHSGSVVEEEDYSAVEVAMMSKSSLVNENHDDPSYSGAFEDQSRIYHTTAEAGSDASKKKRRHQKESNSTLKNAKKVSELTIDEFTVNSRIQTEYIEEEPNVNKNEKHNFNECNRADFGWARHFQPFSISQTYEDDHQSQWLNAIYESFNDQNGLLLSSFSDQQLGRRIAANEALQRIGQQSKLAQRFDPLSAMKFDLWN